MQNQEVNQLFREYLMKGETILWCGQPAFNLIFTPMDIFLVPFSLVWGGFAIFWESSVLLSMFPSDIPLPIKIIFPLFGGLFVIVGLYFIFGRFLFKRWKKQRTFYAVTNLRVLSLSRGFSRQFQESNIKLISGISRHIRSDGIGTLTFGANQSTFFNRSRYYDNTGMDIFSFYTLQPGFYDIPNAGEVYKLLIDIQYKEKSA
jgi:hypothetical protein